MEFKLEDMSRLDKDKIREWAIALSFERDGELKQVDLIIETFLLYLKKKGYSVKKEDNIVV